MPKLPVNTDKFVDSDRVNPLGFRYFFRRFSAMCLDHGTFLLINGDEEVPLGNIASILPGDGRLRLLDLFGKTVEINGRIGEIDLLNKRIVLA